MWNKLKIFPQEELVQFLQKDLAVETAVEIKTNDRQAAINSTANIFSITSPIPCYLFSF